MTGSLAMFGGSSHVNLGILTLVAITEGYTTADQPSPSLCEGIRSGILRGGAP